MIKKLILNQTKRLGVVLGLCWAALSVTAQSGTYGNTFVYSGSEAAVHSVNQTFTTGGGAPLDGIVGTERVAPRGYLSFVGTASWSGASATAHVDGYAKTYMSTAFVFPIGDNGLYRPARVSIASQANPADAAYFRANPTSAITSSLKGGNEPALPSSTYPSVTKAADVQNVSTIEYWDINGAQSAQISLTWDATSGVAAMIGGSLAKLTIVGWDGTKWVSIPSTVDATSILGGASTTSTGSITTNANITPNSYDVYTLAVICPTTSAPTVATATPNPICLGSTTVLTATAHASDTLRWYSDAALTTVVGIGSPVNANVTLTPPVGSTTYYAAYTNGICKSIPASPLSVVVNPIPTISSIDSVNPSTCTTNNGSITLKGLLANTTFGFTYTNANGSTMTSSGTTDASGNLVIGNLVGGSYTNIKVSRLGCSSNTIAKVQLTPPAPTAGTPNTTPICLGTSSVLTATGSGGTITWYADAALTASVGTGSPLTVSPTASTTYYAVIVNGTCQSFSSTATVVVTTNCPTYPISDTTLTNTLTSTPVTVGPTQVQPTGGSLTASIIGGFYHNSGTATIDPLTGVVTVTPNDTAYVGQDTLVRLICYTLGTITKCDTSLIVVNNTAPDVTVKDTTALNTPVTLAALTPLIFEGGTPTTTTSSPKVSVVNGVPTYTPSAGFVGIDTQYVYRCDAATPANCDTTRLIVTILPSIADSTKTTTLNTPVTLGPAVTPSPNVTQTLTASNGTTTLNPDGTVTYTPNPNFVGTDTVKRIVCTTIPVHCDTSLIIINVAPSYKDTTASTPQGTPVTSGTPVLTMPGSTSTVTTTGPTNGTATVNSDGTVTYTPATGFVGRDTVKRIVCVTFADATTKCDTSLIVFVVTPSYPDKNDSTALNTPKVVGTPITTTAGTSISTTATAPNGTVTVLPDGTISYVPKTGFVGIDSIKRIVCLYDSVTTITKCDTSFIVMNVKPIISDSTKATQVNTPVTIGPAVTPSSNVTQTLTALNGTTTLNPDGTVKYTPNPNFVGTDTIRRIVCTTTPVYCDTSIVIVNVAPSYRDSAYGTFQGIAATVGTPVSTMPGSTSSVTTQGPSNGIVSVNLDGTIKYTPNPSFIGVDTVKRIVCVTFADGTTKCDTSLLIINVGPIKNVSTVSTTLNTPLIGIGTPASGTGVNVTASAVNGTVTVNPDGTISYVPKLNTVGTDTIKRVICVTTGTTTKCDTSLIIVNVSPTYTDTSATTSTGVSTTVGNPVLVTSGSVANTTATASNGTVTVNPNGTVSYTPRVGFVGMDTIKRIVCVTFTDGVTKCDTSLIVVRVTAPEGTNPTGTGTGTGTAGTGISTGTATAVNVGPAVVGGTGTTVAQTASAKNGIVSINPDGTLTYTPDSAFSGTDTITRIVCVTYIDGKTICDTSYITIMVGSKELVNYISPNGDGVNDKWVLPAYLFAKYPNLKVLLYNRWGNIVWRSEGTYQNNWGGEHYDGTMLPDGVYYYILELSKEFNESKTGFIEVMRQ